MKKRKKENYPLLPTRTQRRKMNLKSLMLKYNSDFRYMKIQEFISRGDLKCGTLTNATEMITEMALMQMRGHFQRRKCWLKCFNRNEKRLHFRQPCSLSTAAFQSLAPWQGRSMREGHSGFWGYCCGLHALIGWNMSILLNSWPVFHMDNRWLVAQTALNQIANAIPETSGQLHISCVKLL